MIPGASVITRGEIVPANKLAITSSLNKYPITPKTPSTRRTSGSFKPASADTMSAPFYGNHLFS